MFHQKEPAQGSKTIWAVIITAVVTAIVVGGGVYLWQQSAVKKTSEQELTQQPTKIISEEPFVKTEEETKPPIETGEAESRAAEEFETAVNQKDYAAIGKLLADKVNFIINATECCGVLSRESAVKSLPYLNEAGTFNFSQEQLMVKKLKEQIPEFQDETIGIGEKGFLLSYRVNAQNKVDKVFMSVTYELLLK